MKNLKRLLVVALALSMVMGIGVSTYAAIIETDNYIIYSGEDSTPNTLNSITYYDDGWVITTTPEETEQVLLERLAAEGVRDLRPGHNGNPPANTQKKDKTVAEGPTSDLKINITYNGEVIASSGAANTSQHIIQPKTAAEARALADYYAAVVKMNNLKNTGSVEEMLVTYYEALAKTLK